jgi:hypothetical protein
MTLVLVAALVATGIWLGWFYEPDTSLVWDDIEKLEEQYSTGRAMQQLHRGLIFPTALSAVAWVMATWPRRDGATVQPAPVAVLVLLVLVGISTMLVPIGTAQGGWFVTSGTNLVGFSPLPSEDEIVILLSDGSTASLGTLRRWALFHALAGALTLLVAIGGVALAMRRRAGRKRDVGYPALRQ